jgi:hypothetical protein
LAHRTETRLSPVILGGPCVRPAFFNNISSGSGESSPFQQKKEQ